MEEMDYNLLFRWFVGLNADDAVWDATVFTKIATACCKADVAKQFLAQVVEAGAEPGPDPDEHFTVDGTLLEAWGGRQSFQPKEKKTPPPDDGCGPRSGQSDGQLSRRETVQTTRTNRRPTPSPYWRAEGQGKEAKLSYSGHLLVENQNGLIVDAEGLQANGTAERGCCVADAGGNFEDENGDGRRRQGIRYARVRGGVPASAGDAARGAKPCAGGRQRD